MKILSVLALAAILPLSMPAQETPLPPVASEVLKLSQSQIGADVIKNYIQNSTAACNLTADQIISLRKSGVADDVVAALLRHSGELQRSAGATVISAPASVANAPTVPTATQVPPSVTITTNVTTVVQQPVYASPVYTAPVYVSPEYYDYYYPRSSFSFGFGIPFGHSWGGGHYGGGWGHSSGGWGHSGGGHGGRH